MFASSSSVLSDTKKFNLLVEISWIPPKSGKIWKLSLIITNIENLKAGNLITYKTEKIKFFYEGSADNKIFFYCNAGWEKVVWAPHQIFCFVWIWKFVII